MAKFPCPRPLFARRRGGSAGSGCGAPFSPRVPEHLVGLGFGPGDGPDPPTGVGRQLLGPVPEAEQVQPVAPGRAGQSGGRGSLGDPAEDRDQLDRGAAGPLESGSGVRAEHPPAVGTPVVRDRSPVAGLDPEPVGPVAPRAAKPVRVEEVE